MESITCYSGQMTYRNNTMQDRVLEYVIWHWRNVGFGPTYRSIMDAVGYRSTASVYHLVKRMEREGLIVIGANGKGIRVISQDPRFCEHDWRVLGYGNPMPIVCANCDRQTEVEYDPPDPCPVTDLLKYTGAV